MGSSANARRGQRKGDFLAGKYLLEDCLGIGGMGEVYRATNVSLGRAVAIKLLSAEFVDIEADVLRFLREARAAAAVRHSNVVDVFDVARDEDGTPFIVQELLAGEDLEHYLNGRGGRLPYKEALEIMIPVADAVAAAHARDVVHRDLKPANIFLSKERDKLTPKVLDFGACLFPTIAERSAKEIRMLIGTPHYMAPEQIVSKADVDQRSDVWALGIILYEMIVGETPFEADSAKAVMELVKTRDVPRLRQRAKDVPAELEDLIAECTKRDRLARLPNAAAVHERMRAVRERIDRAATPDAGPARGPRVDELDDPLASPLTAPKAAKPAPVVPRNLMTLNSPESEPPPSFVDSLLPPADKRPAPVRPPEAGPKPARPLPGLPRTDPDDVPKPLAPRTASPKRDDLKPTVAKQDDFQAVFAKLEAPPKAAGARLDDLKVTFAKHEDLAPAMDGEPAPRFDSFEKPDAERGARARPPSSPPPAARPRPEPSAPPRRDPSPLPAPVPRRTPSVPPDSSMPPVLDPRAAKKASPPIPRAPSPPQDILDALAATDAALGEPSDDSSDAAARAPERKPTQSDATAEGAPKLQIPTPSSVLNVTPAPAAKPSESGPAPLPNLLAAVALPAIAVAVTVRFVPALGVPLGRALRGDSPLASGVLAVVALLSAAALCARSLLGARTRSLIVAAAASVVFGIVMIIVTFSASEAAELGVPSSTTGLPTFVAPIAPLALALAALGEARRAWARTYTRGDAIRSGAVASALFAVALVLSPVGAIRSPGPAPGNAAPPARAVN